MITMPGAAPVSANYVSIRMFGDFLRAMAGNSTCCVMKCGICQRCIRLLRGSR